MHAIKLEYTSDSSVEMEKYFREYGKLKRIAYNKFVDGLSLVEIIHDIQKNINTFFDRSWIGAICLDAQTLFKIQKDKKKFNIVFGGRKNLQKLNRGNISKEDWNKLRNPYVYFVGSKSEKGGNRKFKIDFERKKICFCPERGVKFELNFSCSNSQEKIFNKIIPLLQNKEIPLTYTLKRGQISILIDEIRLSESRYKPIEDRILSLDLNPNFIALTVCDYGDEERKGIVHKQIFNLTELNKNLNTNKRHFELLEISNSIIKLAKHFRVETMAVEKLQIDNKNHKKGKTFNRLVNNLWNKTKFVQNLTKHCNLNQIKIVEILPQYSSFIGCLMNPNEIDSIAAALEIGRRANLFIKIYYKKTFSAGKNIIFPRWNKHLLNQWKEEVGSRVISNWKDAFRWFKENPKFSYRILFGDESRLLFRYKNTKSLVTLL